MLIKTPLISLLFFLSLSINAQQEVPIGAGSYNLSPPSGGAVPQHSNGTNALPKVSPAFNQPIQTNDWWTSLLYKYYQNQTFLWEIHSWKLYAHPLAFQANRYGLDVKYPDQVTVEDYYGMEDAKYQYAMTNQDFTIGVTGMDLGVTDTVKVVEYGDWHVKAEWLDQNGKILQATIAHGSPYTFFETNTDDVYLRFLFGHTINHTIGNNIIGFTTQGHHYALFAPTGTAWQTNAAYTFDENNLVSGTANNFARMAFTVDLDGKGYFSMALLPDNSLATLQDFAQHAYAFIDSTNVSWEYDEANAQLNTTFTTKITPKEVGHTSTLQALYYHQWKHSDDLNTNYTYQSPRGEMKVVDGNSFSTSLKNTGILPVLPPILGAAEKTTLYQFIEDEFQVSNTYVTTEDTYWQGKRFGRQADLIAIADQVGHIAARDKFLADLKFELEDWLTAENGETDRGYFYYDENWNTLIGYPANFGSDIRITDHHFHYGYFIKAAAMIARYDANWIADSNWGAMIKLLIKDVNNWDKSDTQFPFLRCFDVYAGHSWANGHANFHWGNDQEASSESINFSAWVYALGLYTEDTTLRDLGLFLYLNEAEAARQYWFNQAAKAFPADYDYQTATRIWGNGADKILGNTFEAESEYQLGINTFPIQAPLLYLGLDTSLIIKSYQEAANLGNGLGEYWEDIMWGYLAMARPSEALADYLVRTNTKFYNPNLPWLPNTTNIYQDFSDYSLSPAQLYHWLQVLNNLGTIDTCVTATYPAAMVFKKEATKTYIVDNPKTNPIMVSFSDGEQLTIPAQQTFYRTIPNSSCSLNDLLHLENTLVSGTYVASTIETTGPLQIADGTIFKAKTAISLGEGFGVAAGQTFAAVIEDCTANGVVEESSMARKSALDIVKKSSTITPSKIALHAFPNPTKGNTTIQFYLPKPTTISLKVYDINGRLMQTLISLDTKAAGEHQVVPNLADLEGGVYFLVLGTLDGVYEEQLVVVD